MATIKRLKRLNLAELRAEILARLVKLKAQLDGFRLESDGY